MEVEEDRLAVPALTREDARREMPEVRRRIDRGPLVGQGADLDDEGRNLDRPGHGDEQERELETGQPDPVLPRDRAPGGGRQPNLLGFGRGARERSEAPAGSSAAERLEERGAALAVTGLAACGLLAEGPEARVDREGVHEVSGADFPIDEE